MRAFGMARDASRFNPESNNSDQKITTLRVQPLDSNRKMRNNSAEHMCKDQALFLQRDEVQQRSAVPRWNIR